ncbi:MAG: polyprenol phosphomannose-dependent alpha 1,6 mannosyltransferase MptB [Solirubrobacterales bacterium]|nr:polyprenol phosphomannose-dependent alpha 1,6 mannosyltransferase MptB [Solirubrobacterales bacterium]
MSATSPLGATPNSGALELRRSPLDIRRTLPGVRVGLLGLAGLIVTGLVISIAAAGTNALLPESIRPVPSSLAGPFGSTGLDLGTGGVIVVLLAMLASYVVAVKAADRLSARAVLMTIAALHALVLLAPPLLSTDVFSYQAYARMGAVYGTNPYLFGPHAIALDPLFPFVGAKWSYIPTAYGPVFTALSYVLAPLSIAASALAYKAIAVLASLATVVLVWNAARLRGVDPVRAVALVGLNPLVVVYGVGGGHNDLLMLAAVIGGVYLMLAHRERTAGAAMMVAVALKLTAGLMLPFALAGGARRGARSRRVEVAIGAAIVAAVLTIPTLALFGTGPIRMLSTLKTTQDEGDWMSIPGFISTRLGLGTIGHAVGIALGSIFVILCCWLVIKAWRGQIDWIDGAGWATLAMIVTAGALLPWYVAWLMPLAALATDRRLWRNAVALTVVIQCIQLLGYIPHGSALGL